MYLKMKLQRVVSLYSFKFFSLSLLFFPFIIIILRFLRFYGSSIPLFVSVFLAVCPLPLKVSFLSFSRNLGEIFFVILSMPQNEDFLVNLTLWICSGEIFPVFLVQQFFSCFPDGQRTLCNFCGSTEVMGNVSFHVMDSAKELQFKNKVPIGRCTGRHIGKNVRETWKNFQLWT